MTGDEITETTGELAVGIVGVGGPSLDALTVAIAIGGADDLDDDVATVVADLTALAPPACRPRGQVPGWVLDALVDDDLTRYALTADALWIARADAWRRYPVPSAGGLVGMALAGPGELLVCGPGTLGRIRCRPGRIDMALVDDDGPGLATAVAAPPGGGRPVAVGTAGAVWTLAGPGRSGDWIAHEATTDEALVAVAWLDASAAIVAGADGGIYRWDGQTLQPTRAGEGRGWHAAAAWRGQAYFAGAPGVVRLDGDRLTTVTDLPVERLATAAERLFGWAGSLLVSTDGSAWTGGLVHLP